MLIQYSEIKTDGSTTHKIFFLYHHGLTTVVKNDLLDGHSDTPSLDYNSVRYLVK